MNTNSFSDSLYTYRQTNAKKLPEYTTEHYEPLNKPQASIRLLKLFSSSPNNPEVAYIATLNIRKGERIYAKYVKPDLISALRALRHYQKDRYLWVDAVCIDLNNTKERNKQVEMMAEIYGKAKRVCIWLGDPTESSQLALSFIKNEVLQLQNFDDLCDKKADTRKWNALLELMQRPWFSRRWVVQEISLSRKALIYCGTDRISWKKFAIAVELFVEVETATHRLSEVMKKDPNYYHVPGWFEYVSALGASLLVDATGRLFRDYKQLKHNRAPSVGSWEADLDQELEIDSDLEALTDDDESDSSYSVLKQNSQTIRGQPLLSLEYLVSSLSIFDTSIEHDTIYALLAIAKDTTPRAPQALRGWRDHTQNALERFTQKKRYNVDYNQPYVDVCKDFIQFCIDRSVHTEPSRSLDILFRPWATEERMIVERRKALAKAKENEKAKQRWTRGSSEQPRQMESNNSSTTRRNGTSQQQKRKRSKHLTVSIGENASSSNSQSEKNRAVKRQRSNNALSSIGKGARGDEAEEEEYMPLPSWIPQLSRAPFAMYSQAGIPGRKMGRKNADPLVGMPSSAHKNYSAAETKKIDIKTFRFRKRTGDGLNHFSMYVKGFVFDTIKEVQHSSQGGAIPSEWASFGDWSVGSGDPPEEFWRTIVADRGRDGKNPPVYYARACKESFEKGGYVSGSVSTTDLINNERCSVIAQFCRRVQAVIWNRALVRTQSGRLGLVGHNVQPGDLVCILYGCSVPVILRKEERKTEEVMEQEIQWEIEYLKDKLGKCCRMYLDRTKFYKTERKKRKNEYDEWESGKRKEWKKGKGSKEWRRRWNVRTEKREEELKSTIQQKTEEWQRKWEEGGVESTVEDVSKFKEEGKMLVMAWFHYAWLKMEREFSDWKEEKRPLSKQWAEIEKQIEKEKSKKKKQLQKRASGLSDDESDQEDLLRHSQISHTQREMGHVGGSQVQQPESTRITNGLAGEAPIMTPTSMQRNSIWNEPKMNWREFELWLKYGRMWRKRVKERKEEFQRRVEKMLKEMEKDKRRKTHRENYTTPTPTETTPSSTEHGQPPTNWKEEYDRKVRRNVKKSLGKDRYQYYSLLGESYIHGMMDGEAMSVQNGNSGTEEAETIPAQVFEIR